VARNDHRGPLIAAGVALGAGLGGFVDGILLHQVLQWHHMVTSAGYPPTSVSNLQVNTFWDGLFHVFTWTMTALGLGLLWRAGKRTDVPWSARTFAGALLAGWGIFTLAEGLVDHHLLGIHHVREDAADPLPWDLGYLVLGGVLLVVGWTLIRTVRSTAIEEAPRRRKR